MTLTRGNEAYLIYRRKKKCQVPQASMALKGSLNHAVCACPIWAPLLMTPFLKYTHTKMLGRGRDTCYLIRHLPGGHPPRALTSLADHWGQCRENRPGREVEKDSSVLCTKAQAGADVCTYHFVVQTTYNMLYKVNEYRGKGSSLQTGIQFAGMGQTPLNPWEVESWDLCWRTKQTANI